MWNLFISSAARVKTHAFRYRTGTSYWKSFKNPGIANSDSSESPKSKLIVQIRCDGISSILLNRTTIPRKLTNQMSNQQFKCYTLQTGKCDFQWAHIKRFVICDLINKSTKFAFKTSNSLHFVRHTHTQTQAHAQTLNSSAQTNCNDKEGYNFECAQVDGLTANVMTFTHPKKKSVLFILSSEASGQTNLIRFSLFACFTSAANLFAECAVLAMFDEQRINDGRTDRFIWFDWMRRPFSPDINIPFQSELFFN